MGDLFQHEGGGVILIVELWDEGQRHTSLSVQTGTRGAGLTAELDVAQGWRFVRHAPELLPRSPAARPTMDALLARVRTLDEPRINGRFKVATDSQGDMLTDARELSYREAARLLRSFWLADAPDLRARAERYQDVEAVLALLDVIVLAIDADPDRSLAEQIRGLG